VPPPPARAPLHERAWFQSLLLIVAVLFAFGTALDGELVWDDPAVVGVAARLPSLADAFSRDLFGLGAAAQQGAGASYWRPLVTLSYAIDIRLFSRAPELGLHFVNLLWHALAAVLVGRALARWTGARTPAQRLACSLAALLWAVLPAKAENVAWISGRADPMGLALLLAGLELRRALTPRAARVAAAGAAVLLAVLCKEAFLIAPALVALDLLAEGEPAPRLWRAPEIIASMAVSLGYFVFRQIALPLHGGGAAMFAELSPGDRVMLVLETLGHAFQALTLVFESHLLRGPIGFAAPFVLRREPAMAALGALGLCALALVAVRSPRLRPAVALLVCALLPIANLLPAGLESRMNDRFLYVPSLALALTLSVLLGEVSVTRFRLGAAALVAASMLLLGFSNRRSALFTSSDALWSWERAHGDRATSVLQNAARAAERAGRFVEARDGYLATVARYRELGFDEGFPLVMSALHAQATVVGAENQAFLTDYRRALQALLAGQDVYVNLALPGRGTLILHTGSPEARVYAAARSIELRARLDRLDAPPGS
jgi:hypothetical protein